MFSTNSVINMIVSLSQNFTSVLHVKSFCLHRLRSLGAVIKVVLSQAAQALFMNHTRIEHNMASNYKGLYGIFYKITTKVVESVNIQ